MTDKKRIFISHATKDDPLINQIVDVLHKADFDTFVDHDGGLTPRTVNWDRDLRHAIVDCHAGILVMTEKSLSSNICGAECLLVQELKKPLYIIRAEVCKPESVWLYIKMIQYANIVDQFDMGMNALIRALNGDVDPKLPTAYMPQITGMSEMTQYLPYLRNPLRGRLDDANELLKLLQTGDIVQLIGFGGLGKSRISAEIARAYPNGALWHRCNSITRREDIQASLRVHLGLEMDAPIDLILEKIAIRKSLIVIDNAEDVAPAHREGYISLCNQLANHGVPILLTSREKWDKLPAKSYQLKSFPEHDIEIVTQMTQDFYAQFGKKFTDDEARQLAKSGRFHPKLIEFAVGQIGGADHSYATIVRRLDELTHEDIQKALYEMITKTLHQMRDVAKYGDKAYDLIHNLTWLQATFPKEAIIALKPPSIVTDDDLEDAIAILKRYQFIRNAERDGRYQLAELVREAIGTNQDVFNAYADFYIQSAREIFVDLQNSPELWGDQEVGENFDNIVNINALGAELMRQTTNGTQGNLECSLEFAYVTKTYVMRRIEMKAWGWLEMGLSSAQTLLRQRPNDLMLTYDEAWMFVSLGIVYQALEQTEKALFCMQQSLSIYNGAKNATMEAWTFCQISHVYNSLGDKQKALDYCEQALFLYQILGDLKYQAYTLCQISGIYGSLGDKQKALDYCEQALFLYQILDDFENIVLTNFKIAMIYEELQDLDNSIAYLEQCISINDSDDFKWGFFHHELARLKHKRGDTDVPTEFEFVENGLNELFIFLLLEIYQSWGEYHLRNKLKRNFASEDEIEMLVQIVKQQLGG